jgi:gliding motility-associated-like protein
MNPPQIRINVKNQTFTALLWPLLLLLAWPSASLYAEGTRQLAPTPDDLMVMLVAAHPQFGNFAAPGAPASSRLHVTISHPSEIVYLGLSAEFSSNGEPFPTNIGLSRYRFFIRRASDNALVHGPYVVDNSNSNVNSWSQAAFGNYDLSRVENGQSVYAFSPGAAGDYYIEFQDIQENPADSMVYIAYWDITVARNGSVQPGRVWSQNWALRTPTAAPQPATVCQWNRPFNGTLYSYTSDGFVSKINLENSGFRGLNFNVAFNSRGPGTTGDPAVDRKSVYNQNATASAAEHRIFLNPPDPVSFPDGVCGQFSYETSFQCNSQDSYCLNVVATKDGLMELVIDFNQNGVFDQNTRDVLLVTELTANVNTCIAWNGLRGDNTPVSYGDTVNLVFQYSQGIQHWAAYDVELLEQGFCVESIRPQECLAQGVVSNNLLYYDDRDLIFESGTGQPLDGRNGCECRTNNCRTWGFFEYLMPDGRCPVGESQDSLTFGYGDKSTINTWWYAYTRSETLMQVPVVACRLIGQDSVCIGSTTVFTAQASSPSGNFSYQWSGPNGYVANTPSVQISEPGLYCVTITDDRGCVSTCCKELVQLFTEAPFVDYPDEVLLCYGESVTLTPVTTNDLSALTFTWVPATGINDPSSPSPTVFPTQTTLYTVFIDDVNGCSSSEKINVLVSQLLDISLEGVLETCEPFSLLTASAAIDLDYSWYEADTLVATGAVYNAFVSGNRALRLIGVDDLNCADTIDVVLRGGPVDVVIPDTVAICEGSVVDLTIDNLDSDDTLSFAWQPLTAFAGGTDTNSPDYIENVGFRTVYTNITNQYGCSLSDSIHVAVIDRDIALNFTAEVLCDGLTVRFENISREAFGYLWLFGDGSSSTETDPVHVYPSEGSYVVTLRTVYDVSCAVPAVDTIQVVQPELTADFSYNFASCSTNEVVIDFFNETTLSAGDIIFLEWEFTANNHNFPPTPLPNPTLVLTSSDTIIARLFVEASNECMSTYIDTIVVVLADWSMPPSVIRCPNDTIVLNPAGNPAHTYLWQPATGLSSNTAASPLAFPEQTTLYTVLVSNVLGTDTCFSTHQVLVEVPPKLNLDSGPDIVNCGEPVTLTASLSSPAQLRWFSRQNDLISTEPTITIVPSMMGDTLFVEALDTFGCRELDTVVIVNRGVQIDFDAQSVIEVCQGVEVGATITNLDAADVLTYSWQPTQYILGPSNEESVIIVINQAATVTFTGIAVNQFGCADTVQFTVISRGFNPPLPPDNVFVCEGVPTPLNPGGNPVYVYEWTPADGAINLSNPANPVVTTFVNRRYIVQVLDLIEGCRITDTVDVIVYPSIDLSLAPTQTSTCGEDVTLTISTSVDVDVEWYSALQGLLPVTTPSIVVNPFRTDTFTVRVADQYGCVSSASSIVADNGIDVSLLPGMDISSCQYVLDSVRVQNLDTLDVLSYSWSPVANIVGPTNQALVQYVVRETGSVVFTGIVNNQHGCADTLQFTVTVIPFDGDLPALVPACTNTPTPINPAGNPTYTYTWLPTAGLDLSQPWNPVATLQASQLYFATITDPATGCTVVDSVQVAVFPDVNLQTDGDTVLCRIVPIPLTATTDRPSAIRWENPAGDPLGFGSPYVATPVNGLNTYRVVAIDLVTGCLDTSLVTIDVSLFTTEMPGDTVLACTNERTQLNPGGDPTLIYEWSPLDGAINVNEPWNPVVITATERVYIVRVTDPVFGCIVIDTVRVVPYPRMDIEAGGDTTLCTPNAMLTNTLQYTNMPAVIQWFTTDGMPVAAGPVLNIMPPLGETLYIVQAVSTDGCTERDTLRVFNTPVLATITPDQVICEPTTQEVLEVSFLGPEWGAQIVWDTFGVITRPAEGPVVVVDPNVSDDFSATVTNSYGCTLDLFTTITLVDLPGTLSATAEPDTFLIGDATLLSALGCVGCAYVWEDSLGIVVGTTANVEATPTFTGPQFYTVTAELLGCVYSLRVDVFVIDNTCNEDYVFLPNAFTPNGDGSNDILRIRSNFLNELTDVEFMIYNRWGEEIFRTTNPQQGWDGTYKGAPCAPDVYGFYLKTICPQGELLVQKGSITLLR